MFVENFQGNVSFVYPYLKKDEASFSVELIKIPERNEIPIEINDHLVVEFYSKIV